MKDREGAKPSAVSQRVYDWYNAHYSNVSYREFRNALTESAGYGALSDTETNEQFIITTMNLLIDASFERSGAEFYHGAEDQFMEQISPLDSRLTTLARIHLAKFGGAAPEAVEQSLNEVRTEVEAVARQAGDLHSWRGRVAFGWAYAAAYLLHAAQAILNDKNATGYPLEKLDRALFHLQNGIIEAEQNGVAFQAWFLELVKPRR